ncbi:Uncharacterised protein [Candidatus Burarchaeum australiense]|nr:Uncharacterised protein [Candidatus Burarchaeum australiense]
MMAKMEKTGKNARKETKSNNLALKAALWTAAIVLVVLTLLLVADSQFSFRRMERNPPFELMQNWFLISGALASAVFALSLYLIYIYLKDYFELKSKFTLGVLFAVVAFMLFALTSNPALLGAFGIERGMGPFSLLPMLFAVISLAILAWISSK